MFRFTTRTLAVLAVFAATSLVVAAECPDPLAAILATMQCVEDEDADCASAGYDSDNFIKLHNSIDTKTVIDSTGAYWSGAFGLIDISLDYDYKENIGPNKASIRYIEKVVMTDGSDYGFPPLDTYPFGAVIYQYEHALVTVDDDCRMTLWDQYGDNKEQDEVNVAADTILCTLNFITGEKCVTPTMPPTPDCTKSPKGKKSKSSSYRK